MRPHGPTQFWIDANLHSLHGYGGSDEDSATRKIIAIAGWLNRDGSKKDEKDKPHLMTSIWPKKVGGDTFAMDADNPLWNDVSDVNRTEEQ
jgi:hypothetical protein